MSWTSTTMIASSGLYAYAALYYALVYRSRRPQVIYRAFAGFVGFLALFSFGGGLAARAIDPADGVPFQTLQFIGFLGLLAFLNEFLGELTEQREPRSVRITYQFAIAGAGCAAAGLFFDPAKPSPTYDWGADSVEAVANVTLLGRCFLLGGLAITTYAVTRLVIRARSRSELIPAAIGSVAAILGGAVDGAMIVLEKSPIHVSAHLALVPVVAYSFVLIGRLTEVDNQLADRTDELRRSYDHLRQTQQEIVKKEQLAAVGELSAVIAHEVRNPLAIIKNSVSGLRRSAIRPDDAQTLLHILDAETDRLNRLVNDLLAYARPISTDSGMPVEIRRLVAHAVELAAAGNPAIARVEVELKLEDEVESVHGDEALLRHALINIVDNALQAMPDGGTLTVSCRDTAVDGRPSVAVDFHDTGEGMDTLVRARARDPFFTTRQTGTGLGLAIVERVARAHGGRVEIESRHGQGTTVSLLIPCERGSLNPDAS